MSIFPTKILLATDGSVEANLAMKMSVDLAESTGWELHVVLVEELPYAYDAPTARDPTSGFFTDLHERARKRLDRELEKARSAGGRVAEAHLRVGTAAREVVALAEEMGAGLIVVGSRGLGGLRRALMGSVSLGVVRHAHCSVIVVRGSGDREGEGHRPGKVLLAYDGSKEASGDALHVSDFDPERHGLEVAPPARGVDRREPAATRVRPLRGGGGLAGMGSGHRARRRAGPVVRGGTGTAHGGTRGKSNRGPPRVRGA